MKILVNLSDTASDALAEIMVEDGQVNRTAYLITLIMQEKRRRVAEIKNHVGRPRTTGTVEIKTKAVEELPDEDAPRTLEVPEGLAEYLPMADRKKFVNEYDIIMLEAKRDHHQSTGG